MHFKVKKWSVQLAIVELYVGAMSPKQTEQSMFGEHQRMDVLEIDNETEILLEQLMGEDVEPRRDFVFNKIDFSRIRE